MSARHWAGPETGGSPGKETRMKLYHRTGEAEQILREGFRESVVNWDGWRGSGVFFSNVPLDANEGADGGDELLGIDIPDEEVTPYEIVQHGCPYREFLVPLSVVGEHRPPRRVSQAEEDCAGEERLGNRRTSDSLLKERLLARLEVMRELVMLSRMPCEDGVYDEAERRWGKTVNWQEVAELITEARLRQEAAADYALLAEDVIKRMAPGYDGDLFDAT